MNMQEQKQKIIKKVVRNKTLIILKRPYRQIRITDRLAFRNVRAYKGNKNDTTLLNINFKTIIWHCLDEMAQAKQLTQEQYKKLTQYKRTPASFQSLIALIYGKHQNKKLQKKNHKFRHRLQKLLASTQIVNRIFKNSGSFQMKLTMLKYVQALNCCIRSQGFIIKWKSLRKINVFQ